MKGLVRPTAKNNNQLTEIGMHTQTNINKMKHRQTTATQTTPAARRAK